MLIKSVNQWLLGRGTSSEYHKHLTIRRMLTINKLKRWTTSKMIAVAVSSERLSLPRQKKDR